MTLVSPTLYDQAFRGETRDRIVHVDHAVGTVGDGLWTLDGWEIWIPELEAFTRPDNQRLVTDIRAATGWSTRRLADVLGTSHTTVRRIENGGRLIAGHSGELRRRIADAHAVVSRVFVVANRDPERTARLLEERGPSGFSGVELLHDDQASRAYLAALDLAAPRGDGLLTGSRPRLRGATSALHD